MPIRREFPPRSLDAAALAEGRVDPHYTKVLLRLLAAHAMAEKLTALGYQRALATLDDPALRPTVEKNFAEEKKHARLIYDALEELGVTQQAADRSMISVLKAPSFDAPSYFAAKAAGEFDLLMGSLSLDTTCLIMIGENYRQSSYAPHARAAEIILDEETDHEIFASRQLGDAVERFGVEPVNDALRRWIPRAVNFFGPPGTGFTYDCIRYGLKSRDNEELAELYVTMLSRRCEQLGLTMPALTPTYPHTLA
ncbi:Phenylacetic acid catabolic protein [Candidatus Binatus soli]|jgi:1,2-phenylacetyl-CoA epoxidase catalytic subunit|uniref:Phenylacetic acid catabolic protein n=1 Tax=Candidatus Binatus soli TaxID=1953413 RepID=UPI003D0F2006